MRKILLSLLIFGLLLVAAAVAVPFVFKDKLRAVADRQIAQRVRATVLYDPASIGVSLLGSFPNITLTMKDLRVIGLDSFRRDTLAYLPEVRVGLDVMSVVRGGEIAINSIALDRPDISIRTLRSGRANWDIVISDSAAAAKGQDTSQVALAIASWKITDGHLRYEDLTLPFRMEARQVNHTGKGDFARDVFDLTSTTTAERLDVDYAGTRYVSDKKLAGDVALNMNLAKMLFTFKDNNIRLNDFPFTFAGAVGLPNATDITYDLTFKALETDFKTILSLVPGVFTDKFQRIETAGKVAFDGYYKGTQNAARMPGYGVNLVVTNGEFHYPELPQKARNINLEMRVDNPSGVANDVQVNVPRFHLDLGANPVDGNVRISGLEPMNVDGRLKANVNLAEALKVYPVAGLALRGQLLVDAVAKGAYSKTQMPALNAALRLRDGYVKSAKFPAPIENINLSGTVVNTTGQVDDTQLDLPQFKMVLDGEALEGRLAARNLARPVFDADVRGTVDLTKMTRMFPLAGMTLAGRVAGNVAAKGNMADVEAGRYQNVVASGTVRANNVTYQSKDLPQGVKIASGTATFNNNQINIQGLTGTTGSSDFAASGTVSNYLGYLFVPGQALRGTMNVNSRNFNVNEWLVDEVSARPTATGAGAAPAKANGVLQIPKFFDLVLNSKVDNVVYDNLRLTNAQGTVAVSNQTATLRNLTFNTLGATFGTTGSYSSRDLAHPTFNLGLNIKNLNFQQAFAAFNSVRALAPLAQQVQGVFGTTFKVSGEMGPDMLPNLATLNGKGLFDIVRAAVQQSKVMSQISALTTLPELKNLEIINRIVNAEIVNGNLVVKPFDLAVGDVKMTVGGTNSLSGALAYVTAINAPTGKLGTAVSSQLTRLTGVPNIAGTDRVTLGLNIGGTMASPSVKLTTGSVKGQAKDVAKSLVTTLAKDKLTTALGGLPTRKISKDDSLRRAQQTPEEATRQAELDKKQQRIDAENLAKKKLAEGFGKLFGPKPKPKPAAPDTAR